MRFGAQLREAASELQAPPRARMRILEELRGDLEELYASLRAAGVPEHEARRRAADMLVPTADVAAALAAVHRPVWVRWVERYGTSRSHSIERNVLVLLTTLAIAVTGTVLWRVGLLSDVSLFAIPVLGIGAAAAMHTVVKLVRIRAGRSDVTRVRAGSGDLLVAAVGAALASAFGVLYELSATASRIYTSPEREATYVLEWLRRSVALGALGIGISLACGLGWMLFVTRAAAQERREVELLGPPLSVRRAERTNGRQRDNQRARSS